MPTFTPRDADALMPGYTDSLSALRKLAAELLSLSREIGEAADTLERTKGVDLMFAHTTLADLAYSTDTGRRNLEVQVPKALHCAMCGTVALDGSINNEGLCIDCADKLLSDLQDITTNGQSEDHGGLFSGGDYTTVNYGVHFQNGENRWSKVQLDPEDLDRLPAIMRACLYGWIPTGAYKVSWIKPGEGVQEIEAPEHATV